MSEMIERVAAAVAKVIVGTGLRGGNPDDAWVVGPSILIARTAIEAMREPTEEVCRALELTPGAAADESDGTMLTEWCKPWQAAVDAALSHPISSDT